MAAPSFRRRSVVRQPVEAAGVDACVRVFEQEFDHVYRSLRRFGVGTADAEDLTQEVFLVMLRRRKDWDPDRPLRPWLSAIAFRVALAHRRRRAREVPGGLIDVPDGGPQQEELFASAADRQLVLESLATLSGKHRAVLVLRDFDGLTIKEVAEALRVPVFTAYTRLRAARLRFAKEARRRQLLGNPRAGRAVLAPAILLELNREVPAVPPDLAVRLRARLTAARALPLAPAPPPPWWILGAAAAGALLAAGAWRSPDPRAPLSGLSMVAPAIASTTSGSALHLRRPGSTSQLAAPAPLRLRPAPPMERAQAASLGQGLLGYWRFDEATGAAAATDLTGNGGDCRLHRTRSARFIEGTLGGAVRLGGGAWLECPASLGLQRLATELTISAWVMHARPQANLRTVVSRQRGTGREDDFYLGLLGGHLLFSSHPWSRLSAPLPPVTGRWIHVAGVRSADGTLRLHVDGREIARRRPARRFRAATLADTPYANPILVGAAHNAPDPTMVNQKLDGAIDELLIYDRALSPAEITTLATGTQPPI